MNPEPQRPHEWQEHDAAALEPMLTDREMIRYIYDIAVKLSALYDDLKPEDVAKAKSVVNGPLGGLIKNAFKR